MFFDELKLQIENCHVEVTLKALEIVVVRTKTENILYFKLHDSFKMFILVAIERSIGSKPVGVVNRNTFLVIESLMFGIVYLMILFQQIPLIYLRIVWISFGIIKILNLTGMPT